MREIIFHIHQENKTYEEFKLSEVESLYKITFSSLMRKLYIDNLLIHGFQYFKTPPSMDDIMSKLVVYNNFCGQYYLMPIFCKKKNDLMPIRYAWIMLWII